MRRQLHEPCAATPGGAGVDVGPVGGGQGEPRLADPSRPHQRDDRGGGQCRADEIEVIVAADQPTQAARDVPSTTAVGS